MIHREFTDLWLLASGEEMDEKLPRVKKWSGRALAMAYHGQLLLLESKFSALAGLRWVGIEML
jgi:hypothetical protein